MQRILIAEDEVSIARLLELELGREGFQADVFNDGESALRAAQSGEYHLLLLDIMMPKMDGIEALQLIHKEDENAKVIMITAAGQKEKMTKAINYGASEFIAKPYESEEVAQLIEKVLGK